jgi:hypothetical protein
MRIHSATDLDSCPLYKLHLDTRTGLTWSNFGGQAPHHIWRALRHVQSPPGYLVFIFKRSVLSL